MRYPALSTQHFIGSGLGWGLLAAVAYATMNLCLRAAAVQVDPLLGALVRAVPLCLLSWALFARSAARGRGSVPAGGVLARLVVVGVLFNLTGNGSFQAALAWGGVSLTVPATQGAVLWGGALAGWWLMRERLTPVAALGLLALAAALVPLTMGAGGAGTGPVWAAALAGVVAGLSYGAGNALLRQTVITRRLTQGQALAPVSTTGLLGLLAIVLVRQGPAALVTWHGPTLAWLAVAGVFNAVALGSLSRALSLLPVTRVNALSTLQVTLSAAGGVLLFAEPFTGLLALGLLLSITGTVMAQQRQGPGARGQGSGVGGRGSGVGG